MTDTSRDRPRTVGQLMAALQQFPPDMRVMVGNGSYCREGGYDDWSEVFVSKVQLNYYHESYYGPHTDALNGEADTVEAVIVR